MSGPMQRLARTLYDAAPEEVRRRMHSVRHPAWLGTLRRTTPLSDWWGRDRGSPIDRYYIEAFLAEHRADIAGRALEIKDTHYLDRFGSAVTQADVLDIDAADPRATIVADLARGDAIPERTFDVIVITQTLQFIFEVQSAIAHLARILKPGGVLLATVPGISRIGPQYLADEWWHFTPASCTELFERAFGRGQVEVRSYGNVLAAIAFLTGMALQELSTSELDVVDPFFPVIIAVRAYKAS